MKRFLFSVCAVLAVFGCSGDRNDLPPIWQEDYSRYGYCRYDNNKCEYMSVDNCYYYYGGNDYGDDNTCGGNSYSSSSYSSKGNNISNYRTVVIGTQTWMAENLDYVVEGSKCYDNDPANCTIYGRLYDWPTAMAFPSSCNNSTCSGQIQSPHQGICPSGWHIPSQAEWDTLSSYVQSNSGCSSCDARLLKSTTGWDNNGNGTDQYGFSALPGGLGYSGGSGSSVGSNGYWWSATYAWGGIYYRGMGYYYNSVYRDYYGQSGLFSVRCLQDYSSGVSSSSGISYWGEPSSSSNSSPIYTPSSSSTLPPPPPPPGSSSAPSTTPSSSSATPPAPSSASCTGGNCYQIPAFTCTWTPGTVVSGDMSKVSIKYDGDASNCRANVWVDNYITNAMGSQITSARANFVLDTDIWIAGKNPEGVTITGVTGPANFEWPVNAIVASKATVTCGSDSSQNEETKDCPLIIVAPPEPTITGNLTFKNFGYGSGSSGVFFIGTIVTAANNVTHNVTVTNNTLAGCGEVSVELSGCGAFLGATSVTVTSACTITAKSIAICRASKKELSTATATVVPNPSLSGNCSWNRNPTSSAIGAIPSGVSLSNAYGRCGTLTNDTLPKSAYSGGKYSSWPINGVVDAGTYSVSTNVTCAATQVSCPTLTVSDSLYYGGQAY